MSHFNEKTSEFSSFLESNEIIQNSNNTFSSRQKLSTSDIMPLDNEKDLYDALNNILETNIRDNISSNVQTINEKKPFLPTKLTVSEEISLASKWKDSNLRNEKLQNNNKENDSSNYEEEKNDKLFSYKNFVTIPEQRKKNKEFEEEDNFIHTGNFKKISHLNFKNNVLSEINSSNYIKAEEKLSPKIKKVLVEAKSFNNFRSNEKDEENNSLRFSERFDANIEKFSPLQNKSLMSNINEILCLINKDDNLNISNISSMNLQEEKSQFFENEAESKQNKFNELTNNINDTLKNIQAQINNSNLPCISSENPFYKTPKSMKTHYSSDPNPTQIKILPNQSSLQLTLKKFNFKCLLPFQKTCIDSLQSNISCIITQPTGTGKSTIYQILSGLSDGIIFVITQKQAFLKRKLEKINDSISWGALNPELTYEQQREVLSLAEQRRLKILFITPELFLLDQISIIPDLLVFENPQEMIEKYDFSLYQGKIFRKLLICPLLNQATLKRLKEIFKIERTIPENVDLISIENPFIKEQISFDNKGTPLSYKNTFFVNCTPKKEDYIKLNKSFFFNNLKWIKEDNKNKYLVNFLKNHLNSYTLILCNNKKTSEDLSSFLQKQGIKNMKYSPNCFRNQQIFIGICGVSVDVPFKSSINYVIHYEIPSDFETYLEDIANYSENCGFIGISSDIDYFHQRNSKLSGEVEKSTIENFLANFLFEANKENCSNNFVNFAQEKDILKIISLRLNEISNELDIKSETLKRILEILQEKKVLKFMSKKIVKAAIIFKRKAEEAIAISGILKNIYFHSVNKNGRLRFFVDEIERNSKCSNEEILMELKRFKENNFLTYEIVEEMHIYELSSELESDEENLVDYIYDNFRKNILKQVEKLDLIYSIIKSVMSQNSDSTSQLNKTSISDSSRKNKDQTRSALFLADFLQKYLQIEDFELKYFPELEKLDVLPFPSLQLQNEKHPLMREIRELFESYFFEITGINYGNRNDNNLKYNNVIKKYDIWSKNIVNVLLGLKKQSSASTLNLWKSTKFWKKYYNYNYLELKEVIIDTLKGKQQQSSNYNNLPNHVQRCLSHKKMKLI